MKKLLAALFAGLFAVTLSSPAIAQGKKETAKMEKKKGAEKKTDGATKSGDKKKTGKKEAPKK
ncbi:MAG TPA: hypothetical protein VFO57_01155 [Burkholderiales bacterium]|nr:hypothetical protein [Burkholderiales bacterium]